jgi:pilus assembly protein Flp/PilA
VQREYKRNTEVPRAKMKKFTTRFLRENNGVTAIEYGLIAGLIAVAISLSLTNVAGALNTLFASIVTKLG